MAGSCSFFSTTEEAVGGEQHVEGGEEGAARDLGHFGDAEGEEAAGFSARGVDQADCLLVDEQADRDFGFAQEAFKAGLRAGLPLACGGGEGGVEVLDAGEFVDQEEPVGGGVGWSRARAYLGWRVSP